MKEVFEEATNQLNEKHPLVIATVVRTKGSTPQKPGAKLLVRNDGSGVGTLGGGCVEGDIWYAAKQLMKNRGSAETIGYELNEEIAAQDGLVCGGTMFFLVDPIYEKGQEALFLDEINSAYLGGEPVALASLVKTVPDIDAKLAGKLLIRSDGSFEGTLGADNLNSEAIKYGIELMAYGNSKYVRSETGAEYFVEGYTTPPRIVLCGGGHVSRAIYTFAVNLGFNLTVIDDREEFANNTRFPLGDVVVAENSDEGFRSVEINKNTFIVIATRGHRYDHVSLEAALNTSASYIGLLGSKRKTILIYEELFSKGVSIDRIKDVRAPIGLDINARTPEEIAISIMAEILMIRNGGEGNEMKLDSNLLEKTSDKASRNKTDVKIGP
jgi:xanthine dehydrogenase accessory factor